MILIFYQITNLNCKRYAKTKRKRLLNEILFTRESIHSKKNFDLIKSHYKLQIEFTVLKILFGKNILHRFK